MKRNGENYMKKIAEMIDEDISSSIPDEESLKNEIKISQEFNKRMTDLFHEQKEKPKRNYYRQAGMVAAAMLLLVIALPVTLNLINQHKVRTLQYSDIIMVQKPTFTPDGFRFKDTDLTDDHFRETYASFSDPEIKFTYKQEKIETSSFDEKDLSKYKEVQKESFKGYVFTSEKTTTVLWSDDKYYFEVTGTIDEETAIKIARSVK